MDNLRGDMNRLRRLDGIHIGLLDADEKAALDRLEKAGAAHREYSGAAGFVGISRVRIAALAAKGDAS